MRTVRGFKPSPARWSASDDACLDRRDDLLLVGVVAGRFGAFVVAVNLFVVVVVAVAAVRSYKAVLLVVVTTVVLFVDKWVASRFALRRAST